MLILAAVSIATLTGENGLLTKANQARQDTIDAKNKETKILEEYENEIDKILNNTDEYVLKIINYFDKNDPEVQLGKSFSATGELIDTENTLVTGYIPCKKNDELRLISDGVLIPFNYVYICYYNSDKQLIETIPTTGEYIKPTFDCEYVRICFRSRYKDSAMITKNDNTIYNIFYPYGEVIVYNTMLNGVAFGTSLTYKAQTTGGYLDYLPYMVGATIENKGVGSSFFYYTEENQYNILYNIKNYTQYADKDFVIIEGCVNDWYNGRKLGTYKDQGTDSVCGCLYNMFSHIYSQNPNIQIFVILDHYGRNADGVDMSSSAVRGTYTQYEYYEEVAKCCEYNQVTCLKEYMNSDFQESADQYLLDYIHCNDLGAEKSANIIFEMMKNYIR